MALAAIRPIKSDVKPKPTTPTPGGVNNRDAVFAERGRTCGDLEGDLIDLGQMAKLAADALEDAIGVNDYQHITKNPEFFYLPEAQVGALLFAIHHQEKLVKDHQEAYWAAMDLKKPMAKTVDNASSRNQT